MDDRSGSLGLREVLDLLRDDGAASELRTQRLLDALEGRLMAALTEHRQDLARYIDVHAGDHHATRSQSDVAHHRFDEFIAKASIDEARRQGALGQARFLFDLIGRNWRGLLAIAAAIAAATGTIRIEIGL